MLILKNVCKKYSDDHNEVVALNNIDMELPDKGLVVIAGTSGSGKTTLLNLLGGLDKPSNGEIVYDGTRVDDKSESWWDEFRSETVGFVYQDFNLIDSLSVEQNISLPLKLQNLDTTEIKKKASYVMEKLGLNEYAQKNVKKLSGGQKQRVAIARAIISNPKILLTDEPTGNLDQENSASVFSTLKEIAKECLTIVVTHDTDLAQKYADRIIKITYGRIETDEVMNNQEMVESTSSGENQNEKVEIKEKKRKLPLKDCIILAKEAMKYRKIRCLVSVLIFSITLIIILLCSQTIFRMDEKGIVKYIKEKDVKLLPLTKEINNEYVEITGERIISSGRKYYELIKGLVGEERIIKYSWLGELKISDEDSFEVTAIFINEDKQKYLEYEGELPNDKNEIAIASNIPVKNGDNLIGKQIELNNEKYTVTAIIKRICGKPIEEIYVDSGSGSNLFSHTVYMSERYFDTEETGKELYISGLGIVGHPSLKHQLNIYNSIGSDQDIEELITGRMPEKENEVLITESMLEFQNKNVLGQNYALSNIYEERYGGAFWNVMNLYDYMGDKITVVGIAKGTNDYYMYKPVFDKLYKEDQSYYQTEIALIVDDDYLLNDISVLLKQDIKYTNNELAKVYDLINGMDAFKNVMIIVISVMLFMTVLQMISLFSYSIEDSKKTIGVLRTLGVGKGDINEIFMTECLFVTSISLGVAFLINAMLTNVINDYMANNILDIANYKMIRVRYELVIAAIIISIVMSILSVYIPVHSLRKKKIIALIK